MLLLCSHIFAETGKKLAGRLWALWESYGDTAHMEDMDAIRTGSAKIDGKSKTSPEARDMTITDESNGIPRKGEETEVANRWVAEWSGTAWSLCSGSWALFHDGKEIDTEIPFQGEPADTFGAYSSWYFGGDSGWMEEWDEYEDGMECDEWCDENREWLSTIAPETEWEEIFRAFQAEDFRPNSCGGCI